MNLAKAREYFSAYHEGSLDRGLKQSFELALSEDAQLQAEYRAFERLMDELPALAYEVKVPEDLHELISARVDRQLFEHQRAQKPGLSTWWKGLLLAGAATAVIVPLALKSTSPNEPIAAGVSLWHRVEAPGLSLDARSFDNPSDDAVLVRMTDQKLHTVTLKDESGQVITTFKTSTVTDPIGNSQNELAVFVSVEVDGVKDGVGIALPGTKRDMKSDGSGSLKDFARAFSNYYDEPISIWVTDLDRKISWDFKDSDPLTGARQALSKEQLIADEKDGMIRVQAQ